MTSLSSLPRPTSDHTPIMLSLSSNIAKPNSFKLDNYLLKNNSFLASVILGWQQAPACSDAAGKLVACIKAARAAAKVWKRRFRVPPQIIQNCQFIIQLFDYFEENRTLSASEFQVRNKARDKLHEEIKIKAAYWRQHSKEKRIKELDYNTAYHHAQATHRMRKKYIRMVKVGDQEIVSHSGKTEALTAFFSSIIGVPGQATVLDLDEYYADTQTPDSGLTRAFSEIELKQAVMAMNPISAPGPDGFGPYFFRIAWPVVKDTVMQFAEAFYVENAELERLNRSHMVLLPEKPDVVDVHAFRPICLQNCALKIISKALTSRLQLEIPKLIDLHQTGFVKGRSISETFVYALELVQTCHKRKMASIVLKLDFAKAFDTVSWVGLQSVLQARRLQPKWIRWMMSLLCTSKSAVLVNGTPGPWINCRRGLRQGDPLSPYLFILVVETLQRMIRAAPQLKHPTDPESPCAVLQYADDTLVIFRAETEAAVKLKEILDQFAAFSGLHINFDKSTLVPIHVPEKTVSLCVQAIGCSRESFPQQYLGLPLYATKLPISNFNTYIQKADKFLSSWQADLLNPMGRGIMVNAVLDSILVYLMSSLQLPQTTIQAMDAKRRAFFWSADKNGHCSPGSCLIAWENLCCPREFGGLGVRDLGIQNICLLLKLVHRLHCPQSSAWAQWVQSRASICSLEGDLHREHWQTLRSILPLYQAITTVSVGDGRTCSFWYDIWVGDEPLADRFPALLSHCTAKTAPLSLFKASGIHSSLVPRLSTAATQELNLVHGILDSTQLNGEPDKRCSAFIRADNSLDSGQLYRLIKARGQGEDPRAKFIWKSFAPPRVQLFMWLLTQRRIKCRTVLLKKHIVDSATCEICNTSDESPEHIIYGCSIGRETWQSLGLQSIASMDMSQLHNVPNSTAAPIQEFPSFIALICWHIWKARNAKIFNNEVHSVDRILCDCKSAAELWKFRLPRRKRAVATHWCSVLKMARQAHT